MKIKSIDVLKGGEVLAEPIVCQDAIIQKGTVIKTEYIPLIMSMEIQTVMIEDPYMDYESPTLMIESSSFDNYVERTRRIMEGHIYHSNKPLREFEMIANEIIKEVQDIPEDIIIDIPECGADLYEHTIMVTLLSVFIGKKLHLDKNKLYNIAMGSLLHDIGIRYITVKCESVEFETMDPIAVFELKKHTILGYSALDGENWIPDISRKMILSHHERIDGSGYPMHQKNKEIECRIIQVCDAFHCYISGMETKRRSVQRALALLREASGQSLDKKVVEHLLEMVAPYPVGTVVEITDGEAGVIIQQTTDKDKPVMLRLSDKVEMSLMQEKDVSIIGIM